LGAGAGVQVSCEEKLRLVHLGEAMASEGPNSSPAVPVVNLARRHSHNSPWQEGERQQT